jgi:hypothetical protein
MEEINRARHVGEGVSILSSAHHPPGTLMCSSTWKLFGSSYSRVVQHLNSQSPGLPSPEVRDCWEAEIYSPSL